ncbi:cytosolic factor, phosphatidylinositol/phosphatidylcholine transfer protein [Podochytrium sp. JEL0797]|nr:cytosolic factor, phosphatidylinositol/phosphatidylcholine transfer protein [Podochytrium sp. JEL0797]
MQVGIKRPQTAPTNTLDEFKTRLASNYDPHLHPDALLLRFLKARNNHPEKALKMFLAWQEWRATAKVDEIVQSFSFPEHDALSIIYPRFYHKTDTRGRPIYIHQHNHLDATQLFNVTTPERLVTHAIREAEKMEQYRLPACSLAAGHPVEQITLILDCKGYPFFQFHKIMPIVTQITQISSDYHPETLGTVWIINAPFGFGAVWWCLSAVIAKETADKFQILGRNYEGTLLQHVEAENLPVGYGGTCECVGGCEGSDSGPWSDGSVGGYPDLFWEGFVQRDREAARDVAAGEEEEEFLDAEE